MNRNRAAQAIAARPPDHLPGQMLEDDFQAIVMAYAQRHRWRIVHIRPALITDGTYRTPYDGDPGLPDLIMARDGVVLLAELKSRNGRPTRDQTTWLAAAGPNGRLWTPNDWPAIRLELAELARV